jgi:hypothetical protein
MILAALVDAGLAVDDLRRDVCGLARSQPFELEVAEVQSGGLRACRVRIHAAEHATQGRRLADIRSDLEHAGLPERVLRDSTRVFVNLAEAEARVHGTSTGEVDLHELGGVDTLVDVVGAVAGLARLGVTEVAASPLPLGRGWLDSQHGRLPLPAPATLELISRAQAPVVAHAADFETVTPTGAAILCTLARFERPHMRVQRVGVGTGSWPTREPNILRLWLGQPSQQPVTEDVMLVETNLDDLSPQISGHVLERLLEHGALDAWLTPVQMKKGRPGVTLSALCPPAATQRLADLLLDETTSLGVRTVAVARRILDRRAGEVDTRYGRVQIKLKLVDGRVVGAAPEYESCLRASEEHGVPLLEVYNDAVAAARSLVNDGRPQHIHDTCGADAG